jgi:transposase
MAEWIAGALLDQNLPVVCLETRQVKAALSVMVVKTDRNDARGIAQVTPSGGLNQSLRHLLQRRCVEHRLRQHLFQPAVLFLKGL